MKPIEFVYLLSPLVVGYGVALACPVGKNSGSSVFFRPPAQVFGLVWAILFPLFGLSWVAASRRVPGKNRSHQNFQKVMVPVAYTGAILSLGVWEYIYSHHCGKDKKAGSWVILLAILFVLMAIQLGTPVSRVLACPMLAWLLFALLMNTTEVQNTTSSALREST